MPSPPDEPPDGWRVDTSDIGKSDKANPNHLYWEAAREVNSELANVYDGDNDEGHGQHDRELV